MKWDVVKGDSVVVIGKVLHVRSDGKIDVEIGRDKIAFGVDPDRVCLMVDPEDEEDIDNDSDDFMD